MYFGLFSENTLPANPFLFDFQLVPMRINVILQKKHVFLVTNF